PQGSPFSWRIAPAGLVGAAQAPQEPVQEGAAVEGLEHRPLGPLQDGPGCGDPGPDGRELVPATTTRCSRLKEPHDEVPGRGAHCSTIRAPGRVEAIR